jgi:hypothetical protein
MVQRQTLVVVEVELLLQVLMVHQVLEVMVGEAFLHLSRVHRLHAQAVVVGAGQLAAQQQPAVETVDKIATGAPAQ